jgi:hypothetical protein
MKEKRSLILLIAFSFLNISFAQTTNLIWKNRDMQEGQIFPLAYINGSTSIEKEINAFLIEKYFNQPDSYRDNFYEYSVNYPKPNICGIAITYEHEFNTSPGVWSFTDINYFDLRNGKVINLKSLLKEVSFNAFITIVNERKNSFVQDFKKGLTKDQEDFERLIDIVDYTLNDSIDLSDLNSMSDPYAMSGNYELILHEKDMELNYYWEYGWGLGHQSLPNIILKFTYKELNQFFNDYATDLMSMSNKSNDKR